MRLRPRAGQVLRGVAGGVAMLTMLTLPIVCVRVRENSILDPPIAKSKMATDGDGVEMEIKKTEDGDGDGDGDRNGEMEMEIETERWKRKGAVSQLQSNCFKSCLNGGLRRRRLAVLAAWRKQINTWKCVEVSRP